MGYALITGGSKGIGKAIGKELAKRGHHLVLVARSKETLKEVANIWQQQYGIEVRYLSLDLEEVGAAARLVEWVQQEALPINILVNNAGYGIWGNFQDLSLKKQENMLQINLIAVFELTHLFIPILKENAPAYILNTGSQAGLQAMPYVNAYSASKAFVNLFTRSLHHELKPLNISVTALIPGRVNTHFVNDSGKPQTPQKEDKMAMSPETVARAAVQALFKKKIAVVPGGLFKLMAFVVKLLPKYWVEKLAIHFYKKKEKDLVPKR